MLPSNLCRLYNSNNNKAKIFVDQIRYVSNTLVQFFSERGILEILSQTDKRTNLSFFVFFHDLFLLFCSNANLTEKRKKERKDKRSKFFPEVIAFQSLLSLSTVESFSYSLSTVFFFFKTNVQQIFKSSFQYTHSLCFDVRVHTNLKCVSGIQVSLT